MLVGRVIVVVVVVGEEEEEDLISSFRSGVRGERGEGKRDVAEEVEMGEEEEEELSEEEKKRMS
jgi:Sec-independent protein translocase protein TatA